MTITAESLRELAGEKAGEEYLNWCVQEGNLVTDFERDAHGAGFQAGAGLFLPALVEALGALENIAGIGDMYEQATAQTALSKISELMGERDLPALKEVAEDQKKAMDYINKMKFE